MTREEAIEILAGRYLVPVENGADEYAEQVNKAIDVAIAALSEPTNCVHCTHYHETEDNGKVEGHCDRDRHADLISRADAIDAVDEVDWYHINPKGKMVQGAPSESEAWYKAEDIYKALNALPSAVRPKTLLGSDISINYCGSATLQSLAKPNNDLISRDDAIDAINFNLVPFRSYVHGEWNLLLSKREVIKAINAIPSAESTGALDDAIAKYVEDGYILPSADRPTGEWVEKKYIPYCSNCGKSAVYGGNFCHNCGADMRVEK